MVEGAQALAQLDVDATVPQRALHDVVRRPLVAGRHLAGVGGAALAGGEGSSERREVGGVTIWP